MAWPGCTIMLLFIAVICSFMSVRVVKENERGVIFRLGRVMPSAKGPGIIIMLPFIDRITKVDIMPAALESPVQAVRSADQFEVKLSAKVDYRVADPVRAISQTTNYLESLAGLAGTALKEVAGRSTLKEIVNQSEKVAGQVQEMMAAQTAAWGITISRIELKREKLPLHLQMQCDMAK